MTTQLEYLKPLNSIPRDVLCAQDYERLAHHFIPKDRLAYLAGGSGDEVTLKRNSKVFSSFAITPRPFNETRDGTTAYTLLNEQRKHPFMLAPVAYQTLVHPQGELETARGAEATDTCMVSSTLSSFSLEDIANSADHQRWFQLYLQPTWKDSMTLVNRAVSAGYSAIVLTIDAAIQMPSRSAITAGFQFPAQIQPANLALMPTDQTNSNKSNGIFQRYAAAEATLDNIRQLIKESPLPVLIKGVLNPDDAASLKAAGAAGIIVSNHGGRTLDHVPASLSVLPDIRHAVGADYPVLLDSGIRSGTDAFKAIAQGADAVLVGRLQVYALSVAGALGVAHLLKLLREELEVTMAVAGCASIDDIKSTQLFNY